METNIKNMLPFTITTKKVKDLYRCELKTCTESV